ncbi:MAG: guanylate kinase [Lachnospiraceae bacterium]|nr:guanylate kinase [Lachnospiraceae bacterium]
MTTDRKKKSTHIFCIMGKSSCGKDTIFRRLTEDETLGLTKLVTYTTRPIRAGETEGIEYHFTDAAGEAALEAAGKVIEKRTYHTVAGPWDYFTADDGQVADGGNYIIIATIESYVKLRDFYSNCAVCPIYIYVEDGERLARALARERQQEKPGYAELCRRFLSDSEDFSDKKLAAAGITEEDSYENNDLAATTTAIAEKIQKATET